ncbi:MAG: signal peptidase I [Rickettsiales bacterium]
MSTKRNMKQEVIGLFWVVFLALLFRSVAYEMYYIPSSSMYPNLLIGDRILINKYAYGISKYSFPMSPPLFEGRKFVMNLPRRGDVIVFETDKIYIKRLIGLPGDSIQIIDGQIFINGSEVPKKKSGKFTSFDQESNKYTHTLPNKRQYIVLDDRLTELDNTEVYRVPENHYFFMGDNMDNSNDSRNLHGIGYVKFDNLIGKAENIIFSSRYPMYDVINFFQYFRSGRTFKSIK